MKHVRLDYAYQGFGASKGNENAPKHRANALGPPPQDLQERTLWQTLEVVRVLVSSGVTLRRQVQRRTLVLQELRYSCACQQRRGFNEHRCQALDFTRVRSGEEK